MPDEEVKYDVFISHASEDKENFVRPLAAILDAFGVSVWYDEFTLSIGDSLSRAIDRGLVHSKYGVVVLSKAFLSKSWPEYELRGLTARELAARKKVILPVWWGVSQAEVLAFSPPLADKMSVIAEPDAVVTTAVKLVRIIRPDLFEKIHRRAAFLAATDRAQTKMVPIAELKAAPFQHSSLSAELISRIRLVRAALLDVYPHSMDFWVDGFRRDSHPSSEVAFWERVSAAYLEFVNATKATTAQREAAFSAAFSMAMGSGVPESSVAMVPESALKLLAASLASVTPVLDFQEQPSAGLEEGSSDEVSKFLGRLDREVFPADLPGEIIRRFMTEADQSDPPKKRRRRMGK